MRADGWAGVVVGSLGRRGVGKGEVAMAARWSAPRIRAASVVRPEPYAEGVQQVRDGLLHVNCVAMDLELL
jgi:hypothetical protein